MKRILLILFCVLALPVMASHIVGGEFELIHLNGNKYQLNLIIYFDEINGNPLAEDPSVTARIFRKRDNFPMLDVTLPLVQRTNVAYTQPSCTIGELRTRKILYTTTITLSDQQFSDPEGYYISWERCCRNYQITNIFSENTQAGGTRYAGQTFYLEFPPVTKNGQPFINSTPRLFPPLSDYACPRRFYYVDFAGVDDDGDSLVYSLVDPLNTKTADALPPTGPRPRPYPSVTWRPGFNLEEIIGGTPDLAITTDGFLTVTPAQQGLFVFAVRCQEFRDGVKIGEVRRDFQLLVLDACPVAEPPLIIGKKTSEATTFKDKMNISFSNQVADADRCIQVVVSDPDANKIEDNFTEQIKLRVISLGFKKDMSDVLPPISTATLSRDGTKTFDICFDQCPPNESGIFQVGIIAFDDACSLPLSDTLRITVNIQPPDNVKPKFELPLAEVTSPPAFQEGDKEIWRVKAIDGNNDQMVIGIIPDGFSMEDVGMTVEQLENKPGLYEADLVWDTRCDVYDFREKTSFQLKFIVQDQDLCSFSGSDTVAFNLGVILPGNADPIISTDLQPDEIINGVYMVQRKIFDKLDFNVTGKDEKDETDLLQLSGTGVGFDMAAVAATFPSVSGTTSITSPFDWELFCEKVNLTVKSEFDLRFIVKDEANKCRLYKADTLTVRLKVLPPDNQKPILTITNTNPDLAFEDNFQDVMLGQQISLGLTARDADTGPQDLLAIELIKATGDVEPNGYVFSKVTGTGSAETTFAWLPDCSIFKNGDYENNYSFSFRTLDNRCRNTKADTVTVDFTVRDIDNKESEFIPPNFISANGDSFNEFFAMLRHNSGTGELESILPLDNCIGRFVSISIYNRWGTEVFNSNNRDFQWRPVNQAPGIYFYTLIYSNKEYKGTVTVKD